MTKNSTRCYWMSNKAWYQIVDDKFVLTAEAPPEARKSFEEWKKPRKMTFRRFWRRVRTLFY